jgi:hypothetical protein
LSGEEVDEGGVLLIPPSFLQLAVRLLPIYATDGGSMFVVFTREPSPVPPLAPRTSEELLLEESKLHPSMLRLLSDILLALVPSLSIFCFINDMRSLLAVEVV